jgi:HAMP domain-containing protein
VLLSGLVSRGVTRPIEALSAATRSVATGQGSVPETPATAAVEIRDLYQDFRVMADAIAVRSRYLRDFAAAVSHEFKTPLAGITGAVELLDDHFDTMTPDERRRFLGNISADSARLSALVGRLMDLARADMAMPQAGVASELAAGRATGGRRARPRHRRGPGPARRPAAGGRARGDGRDGADHPGGEQPPGRGARRFGSSRWWSAKRWCCGCRTTGRACRPPTATACSNRSSPAGARRAGTGWACRSRGRCWRRVRGWIGLVEGEAGAVFEVGLPRG